MKPTGKFSRPTRATGITKKICLVYFFGKKLNEQKFVIFDILHYQKNVQAKKMNSVT